MKQKLFSGYEVFVIAIVSIIQFTVVLDFMVLSPLSAILLPELQITPAQFAMVVSAYAISAGLSGILSAGFSDKFDRKKMLVFFYTGFVIGTLFCGLANTYHALLIARIVTGIFGGVIGAIGFSIVTDLFPLEVRGRVMGFVQMSFAASQVLGIPVGLYLADKWGWHSTFLMIVGLSVIIGILIIVFMKPVVGHLKIQRKQNAFAHLTKTVSQPVYLRAFSATVLLATGGFMLMPFATVFSVNNLGIAQKDLSMLYFITGIFSIASGPIIGKLSDTLGKYKVFVIGSVWSMIIVVVYCNLGITPFWQVAALSAVMFIGVSSRIISASALMTAVPEPADRGAFMSINSSVQQISGGIATFIAGLIVVQSPNGKLEHYDWLGYVVCVAMLITVVLMYFIHRYVTDKTSLQPQVAEIR